MNLTSELTAAITIFMLLASEFVLRFLWDRPIRIAQEPKDEGSQYLEPRIKLMFGGLALSTIAIFIRYES